MTLTLIFIIFVLAGFLFKLLAAFGLPPWAERAAWGCWLIASLLWAVTTAGVHVA
jgi:hypothetical protein